MQLSNGAQYEVWIFFSSFRLRLQIRVELGLLSVTDRLKHYYGTLLTSDLFLLNFNFR